ncbi:MAG: hypothetical protein M1832_000427 [Thelocarpon impressellum]|nr:MAG: hypothetical protein M1832_000427 [Thelocarpon impressellum]
MAYPFPRFNGSPQTPQFIKGMESPRRQAGRIGRATAFVRGAAIAAFTLVVLCCTVYLMSNRPLKQLDRIPFAETQLSNYFTHFEGSQDCGISSEELYVPPTTGRHSGAAGLPYCKNRATLLEALSGGGRHGFDAPYAPKGCHYRWYSTAEVCMILDRFDGVVFIGDNMLRQVYTAFNILLRENVALGGLKQWEMSEGERGACRCENQFVRGECVKFAVENSEDVKKNDAGSGHKSPYYCARTPHMYLPVTGSPAPDTARGAFNALVDADPESYKPIPVIHSLSLSTSLSWPTTTASMDEWLALADVSARNVPFLWLGPVAAGHLKPPGQILSQGNNALWHFTVEMAKEARAREMESLGMYNMTMQAGSWDGSAYGERVALVQAMMVVNWLSRLGST